MVDYIVSPCCRHNGIFVLTPAIGVEAFRKGFLKMADVSIIVFDEAHHARKRHPYAQIMDYYHLTDVSDRPRIFGMTASPVNVKLSEKEESARDAIVASVRQLEDTLDAKVVTIADVSEIQAVCCFSSRLNTQLHQHSSIQLWTTHVYSLCV